MTPFGIPVVPAVYGMQNVSHSSGFTDGLRGDADASHVSYASPITIIRSMLAGAAARASSSSDSWTKSTLEPASSQMNLTSSAEARELIIAGGAPASPSPQTI